MSRKKNRKKGDRVAEHNAQLAGSGGRRKRVLTDDDLEAIQRIACSCPHGMTAEDVYKLRSFLSWWGDVKSAVGGYVLKGFLALIIAIGILVAWITNGGAKG